MKVVEYWPGFVDRSDEPRETEIATPADALNVPWIEEKGRYGDTLKVDGRYVMAGSMVVALIKEREPTREELQKSRDFIEKKLNQ